MSSLLTHLNVIFPTGAFGLLSLSYWAISRFKRHPRKSSGPNHEQVIKILSSVSAYLTSLVLISLESIFGLLCRGLPKEYLQLYFSGILLQLLTQSKLWSQDIDKTASHFLAPCAWHNGGLSSLLNVPPVSGMRLSSSGACAW